MSCASNSYLDCSLDFSIWVFQGTSDARLVDGDFKNKRLLQQVSVGGFWRAALVGALAILHLRFWKENELGSPVLLYEYCYLNVFQLPLAVRKEALYF